ncbi:MAG: helix-hairpin-helix domain-containing protein [Cyclobacteriaceae bacterium]|nr:helix-hairpin-helix domain-containing protein [Cyclobacteriaceae bacterium]
MKWLITILIQIPILLLAQDFPKKEIDLSQLADELFAVPDQDLNYEELYENMAQLLSHPINLNQATEEDLRILNILSESQIKNLLQHRKENGNLISVYELQAIAGFDPTTIARLTPFVEVSDPGQRVDMPLLKRMLKEDNNYFITRYERTLESKQGFKPEVEDARRYQGSPDRLYFRFRTSKPGDFSIGFTSEKDAGEKIKWNPANKYYGFDYWSFHMQLQNKGRLKNLVLGDFQNQFGQGLLLGNSFGLGKGSETITTTRRSNLGFMPYTSVNEASYMRGAAATVGVTTNLYLSVFISHTYRDASVTTDTTNATIASFQSTGLHRNRRELTTRKKITEIYYGGVVQYKINNLDCGIVFTSLEFSTPVVRTRSVYNQFTFRGKENTNTGLYINYNLQNFTLYSEIAKTLSGGWGLLIGTLGSLSPQLDVAIQYRKYERDFRTFYSNPFAESSIPQNETGLYWGWKYRINRQYTIAGYTDLFRFPWLRYQSYVPSTGHEWLLRFSYMPSRHVTLYTQFREEKKVRNLSEAKDNLFYTATGTKRNYWLSADYKIHPKVKLKTRAQFSTYKISRIFTKGMAIYQDINLDLGRFTISGRYALFDTDDYENRQYAYENNVWLAYSLPAYYGVGVRHHILAEYTFSRHLRIWLRYAQYRYTDRDTIGSGLDMINGNTKTDLTIQIRWKI